MDNILYKTFGKRVYKAILNLIGSGGGNSGGSNVSGDIKMLAVHTLGDIPITQADYLYTKVDLSNVPDEMSAELDMINEQVEINNEIINFIIDTINDNKIPIVYAKDSVGVIYKLYDYIEFPVIQNGGGDDDGPIKKVNDTKAGNTKVYDDSNDIKLHQDGMAHNNTYKIMTKIVGNKLEADEVLLDPNNY